MKHFYEDIDGWFDFQDFYTNIVEISYDGDTFVEVGCWKGRSSAYMAVEIVNSGKNIKLYCVDTWRGAKEHHDPNFFDYDPIIEQEGALFQEFSNNMSQFDFIVPIIRPSIDAAKQFKDNTLDFVFLDASHEYLDIKNDIDAWYPKVRQEGILAGHDYGWNGPKKAIHEFVEKHKLTTLYIHEWSKTWILKKTKSRWVPRKNNE